MRAGRKFAGPESRRHSTIHVSPMTRAVRAALAASVLALAGTGAAYAGACGDPVQAPLVRCTAAGIENTRVVDLTAVADGAMPTSVVEARAAGSGLQGAAAFTVNIVNSGTISKSGSGNVVGIDAGFPGADLSIVNTATGVIDVESVDGLADGIFAHGADITIRNRGTIEADGYTWAAGIEAQGDSVTVNNSGDISATASAYAPADPEAGTEGVYGRAYGIYAVSYGDGGIAINNSGTIAATGAYATGVYAYDAGSGGIDINNRGDITATADNGFATGINALTNFDDSDIDVVNRGSITASGMNSATGIAVAATGAGSSASVDNRGDIQAETTVYYSTAAGIVVSADADASLRNSGSITVGYGDYAYGGLVLAFAGDASVNNSGDVVANGGMSAYGFVAASQNDYTGAVNSGSITVDSRFGTAAGIDASSLAGTTVTNSGEISASANKYAFGVRAITSQGDTVVDNSGAIATDGKYSFGVFAQSGDGNATIYNSGMLAGSGKYAYGAVAASNTGDAALHNAEDALISGYSSDLLAVGAFANANNDGDAAIHNVGTIEATGAGYARLAYGTVVQTDAGDGLVSNGDTGVISALNSYGAARGVLVRSSAGGDAWVDNAGSISATTTGPNVVEGEYGTYAVNTDAIGVYVNTPGATASVNNTGSIAASSVSGLADGVFAYGAVADVTNSGSITADGYAWGAGIEAQGYSAVRVRNSGDITATASAYVVADEEAGIEAVFGHAFGIYASSLYDGGVGVDNRGTIAATGVYATGVYAYDGGTGGIGISNRGDITATADDGIAAGIDAVTAFEGSDIGIVNRGSIAASGYNSAYAVSAAATGAGSGIEVINAGALSAAAADTKYGPAAGVIASGDGDVVLRNTATGTIDVSGGSAYGLAAFSFAGDADVINAGDIAVQGKYAYGIVSSSQNGTAHAVNSGDIDVVGSGLISSARGIDANGVDADVLNRGAIEAYGKYSRGISAVASAGDAEVRNQGSVYAGGKYSYGIAAVSSDGDVRVTNAGSGSVDAYSYGSVAVGLLGISALDDVEIVNAGSVIARGDKAGLAAGVYASAGDNDVSVVNRGTLDANTVYGNAFGVLANIGGDDELSVVNRGDIQATSVYYDAVGVDGTSANGGDVSLRNAGTIFSTSSLGDAIGLAGTVVGGELALVNTGSGSIEASTVDGDAIGMLGVLTDAGVTIRNAGSITVASTNGNAYAIRIEAGAPLAPDSVVDARAARQSGFEPLIDLGNLAATGAASAGDAAAATAAGTATIINQGSIIALSGSGQGIAVYGSDGVEKIFNSGSIDGAIVGNGGDDVFWNLAGGSWSLTGSGTDFGAGDDSFFNARRATLSLADAGITFGGGNNQFHNMGLIKVSGVSTIDMTGGSTSAELASLRGASWFTNDGVIDLLDGAADDKLTIIGGFDGRGAINLDVSLDSKLNDQLFVQGGIGKGTRQVVNVMLLDGLPKSSNVGTGLQLVHVSGDTSPSAFVAGSVLGVSPRDFLSMGMALSTQPGATLMGSEGGGSSYMLSVDTFVSGLNAAGVLASSTALAVDSLMTSTIGNRSDRTYMTTRGGQPAFAGITPWMRGFSDEGGMSPDHLSGNFGQMSNSRVNQDNYGTELGMEFRADNGFRFGTMFGKSEGKQYLVDDRGMNLIRGSTVGLYGTWVAASGFYVDASWRTMQFRSDIDSVGGRQRSEGHAVSTELEVGQSWTLDNGLTIAPKVRYTATSADGLRFEGDQATFESQDTQWRRATAGVSLWKTFGAAGWQWTPYGEVSVMETFEGVTRYAINDDYFGDVMTEGTSALVKFGIGAQKGRWSWNGGVNWLDGADFSGAFGGRMSLHYSW